MELRRVIALAKKDLKKTVREPAALFMTLLFPLIMALAFGVAFGGIGGGEVTGFDIGVVSLEDPQDPWAIQFVEAIEGTGVLWVKGYDINGTAQGDLSQGRLSAVLVIPGDFGEGCSSYRAAPSEPSLWVNTSIRLYLDSGSMMVTQAIPHLVNNALSVTVQGQLPQVMPSPIHVESPSLVEARRVSTFDYMAPGLFPFAAIFLTMIVAQSFVYERQTGLLRRILVTPTTSAEFMLAQVLSNMVVALAQVALVFAGAFLVGYRPYVDASVLAFSFLIVSAFSLCCIGFGLVAATIAKSDGVATGISFFFIMPQMLLGTFVPMGGTQLGRIAARFMPSYYVTDALTSLLLRGAAITSPTILFDAAVVPISGILILLVGVALFGRYGKT